jgi:signal transduction histidine kinase
MQHSHSLDRYIFTAFALFFAGVLAIGGASLFMVQRMMVKTYAIEEESKNVDFINHLHNKTYSLIIATHHFMMKPDEKYTHLVEALTSEIDADIVAYIRHEQASDYPEAEEEIVLLQQLRENLAALRQSTDEIGNPANPVNRDASAVTAFWDDMLDRHAFDIQTQIKAINQRHFDIITRKVEKSKQRQTTIITLYLLFSTLGVVLLYFAYRMHSRHVVKPLKNLASAVGKISEGDLTVRVQSDSHTEIGELFAAFNHMVERLQVHEERLLDFSHLLENKVEERTRELQSAYDSLQQAQDAALRFEKLAMLGQIAASVNHEIRTPLNALYMNLQLIRRAFDTCGGECSVRGDIGNRIGVIDREVQRISDMLEEFVRYARFAPPSFGEVDVNRTIRHVAEMLNERAARSHVELQLSLSDSAPPIQADADKLVQALVNLCINAIHAMPQGGRLSLEAAPNDDGIEIIVADTGMGVAEADREKIFLPFFTNKESGLGFGLSIVQRIVEDHGGRITCDSKLGEGTRFIVWLPKHQANSKGPSRDHETADR